MESETIARQQKSSFASTFLWILLSFLILYILVTVIFRPNHYLDVEDVSIDDLDKFLNAQTSVLYHHPDCPHCKKMLPMFKNMSPEFPKVRFLTIDASKNDIPFEEQIGAYPTIRIYNGKKIGGEMVGQKSNKELKEKMKSYLDNVNEDNILKQIETFFKNLTSKRQRNLKEETKKDKVSNKKDLFKTTSSAF